MNNKNNANPVLYTTICTSAGVGTSKTKYIGYENALGCEMIKDRCVFHKFVHPETEMILGDFTRNIKRIAKKHIEKGCRGMIITLPCQSFSIAGGQHLGDNLTWLFLDALRLIKKINKQNGKLDWIIWENAPYFISKKQDNIITDKLGGKTILEYITEQLASECYKVNAKILDASWYGTPQARKRGIILCKKHKVWEFPEPDDKQLTCGEVIGDRSKFIRLDSKCRKDPNNEYHRIPYVPECQENFIRKVESGKSAFNCVPKDEIINSKGSKSMAQHTNSAFARNLYNRPVHTITQGSDCICGDWTLHPGDKLPDGSYSDPRPFSVAEVFALTGLDENYIKAIPDWAKPHDKLLRQICGEALLPNLVNRLLSTLK